jgi:hypothetical protein
MTSLLVLLSASILPAQAGEAKEVKILAQAPWTFARVDPNGIGKGATTYVIRSEGDLIKASGLAGDGRTRMQLARFLNDALKIEKMDYDKHMLVVVTGGVQASGGFSLKATKAMSDGKNLTLHWKLDAPKGAATDAITHPAGVFLLERVAGEVRFQPAVGGKDVKGRD